VTPASIIFGNSVDLDRTFLSGTRLIKDSPEGIYNMPDPYDSSPESVGTWISNMLSEQARIIDLARKHLSQKMKFI
jgi:hypothetical protein